MSFSIFTPQIIVFLTALLFLFVRRLNASKAVFINIIILMIAFIVELCEVGKFLTFGTVGFGGYLFVDKLTIYINLMLIFLTILILFSLAFYKDYKKSFDVEILSMFNFTLFGFMLVSFSAELVTLFISVEIAVFSLFSVIGYSRSFERSSEAVLKYFITNSFMAAFYLLGMVFIYGELGTTKILSIGEILSQGDISNYAFLYIGVILLLFSGFFKIGTFGFYNYGLDSYYGADLPFSGLVSSVAKFGFVVFFIRLIYFGFMDVQDVWKPIVYVMAILTMIAGNLMAYRQKNIKKMLLNASLVHIGYILIALSSLKILTVATLTPTLYYLGAYTFVSAAIFLILAILSDEDESNMSFESFKGLTKSQPILSFVVVVCMLSFIGFPYTIGFLAKIDIFINAISYGNYILVFIAILMTVVSLAYYLRFIKYIYFDKNEAVSAYVVDSRAKLLMFVIAILIIVCGLGLFGSSYIIDYFS